MALDSNAKLFDYYKSNHYLEILDDNDGNILTTEKTSLTNSTLSINDNSEQPIFNSSFWNDNISAINSNLVVTINNPISTVVKR